MSRRILIVAPGLDERASGPATLLAAARRAGFDAELTEPASENELRRRLQGRGVEILYVMARGRLRAAAGHGTLDLDGARGPASRPVNLRHLASLITSASPDTRLVVLQGAEGSGVLSGFAEWLVGHGVPAAILWPPVPLLEEAARRLFEGWRDGASLARLAGAAGLREGVECAGCVERLSPLPSGDSAAAAAAAAGVAPAPASPVPLPPSPDELRRRGARETLHEKRLAGRFDVFLCHNSVDKPAVRAIANALRERGILPWLDEWELQPGQPWQWLLEQQIESIRSAAVCVGRAGVGPWQEQELYGFLREFVARKAPVIPVLLPDAPEKPELPVFLRAMMWVDFRQADADPLDRLEWGITGVRPAFE